MCRINLVIEGCNLGKEHERAKKSKRAVVLTGAKVHGDWCHVPVLTQLIPRWDRRESRSPDRVNQPRLGLGHGELKRHVGKVRLRGNHGWVRQEGQGPLVGLDLGWSLAVQRVLLHHAAARQDPPDHRAWPDHQTVLREAHGYIGVSGGRGEDKAPCVCGCLLVLQSQCKFTNDWSIAPRPKFQNFIQHLQWI